MSSRRYFIWSLVFVLAAAIGLLGSVQIYVIDTHTDFLETTTLSDSLLAILKIKDGVRWFTKSRELDWNNDFNFPKNDIVRLENGDTCNFAEVDTMEEEDAFGSKPSSGMEPYEVGRFVRGKYKKGVLLDVVFLYPRGTGYYQDVKRFVQLGDKYFYLSKNSYNSRFIACFEGDLKKNWGYMVDEETFISSLELPDFLYGADENQTVMIKGNHGFIGADDEQVIDWSSDNVLFVDVRMGNKVYNCQGSDLCVRLPDGSYQRYGIAPPQEITGDFAIGAGNIASNEYYMFRPACSYQYHRLADRSEVDLFLVGESLNGQPVHVDKNKTLEKKLYDYIIKNASDPSLRDMPYAAFDKSAPIIFYEDAFGRLVTYINVKYFRATRYYPDCE